jgi:hypothetical protein
MVIDACGTQRWYPAIWPGSQSLYYPHLVGGGLTCRRTWALALNVMYDPFTSFRTPQDVPAIDGINNHDEASREAIRHPSSPLGWDIHWRAMNSGKDVKQAMDSEITSEDVVQDSDLNKQATTTKERISAYFTIAAAAFGLISDGCKS